MIVRGAHVPIVADSRGRRVAPADAYTSSVALVINGAGALVVASGARRLGLAVPAASDGTQTRFSHCPHVCALAANALNQVAAAAQVAARDDRIAAPRRCREQSERKSRLRWGIELPPKTSRRRLHSIRCASAFCSSTGRMASPSQCRRSHFAISQQCERSLH